jgi:hypothetical protein
VDPDDDGDADGDADGDDDADGDGDGDGESELDADGVTDGVSSGTAATAALADTAFCCPVFVAANATTGVTTSEAATSPTTLTVTVRVVPILLTRAPMWPMTWPTALPRKLLLTTLSRVGEDLARWPVNAAQPGGKARLSRRPVGV